MKNKCQCNSILIAFLSINKYKNFEKVIIVSLSIKLTIQYLNYLRIFHIHVFDITCTLWLHMLLFVFSLLDTVLNFVYVYNVTFAHWFSRINNVDILYQVLSLYVENCLNTRGPKGHISCTWVQCATFLRNRPGQPSCFSDRPKKYKLGRGCWDLASHQVSLNSVQPFQKRNRKCLSQSEARAAILFFRSAWKTQTW